ncbi:DUF2306 domain-containing protein [Saccharospirillum salsuginis]|uniref:DUF2306 domain-containing protein n=1 Tax=Saccharospirillum salsuginis TaxID=418750 RepID=A0A918NE64_9GAMM|nr:DUF2306 domain-containing protein [Saccharospirillum salsuginis]GGX63868.1 hypothetical protein GCM10007392_34390 [Saccharospirillum salsuginis]
MFSSNIGLVHTLFAIGAIATGGLVVLSRKGTKNHRLMGYIFFSAMVIMNLTALFTQSIYSFGPFHWMAIGSLVFVTGGVAAPVLFRKNKNWLRVHYDLMLWSYVGLIAAMFSEIAVRVPAVGTVIGGGALFWMLVIGSSVGTFIIGGLLINGRRRNFF